MSDGLIRDLLALHRMVTDHRGFIYCEQCCQDLDGELDYADWPCQTARLLAQTASISNY